MRHAIEIVYRRMALKSQEHLCEWVLHMFAGLKGNAGAKHRDH